MIIDNNIKIKHFYRFVEFVSKLLGKSLPHERFKLIALDLYKAESKEEFEVKKLGDSYLYLLNNINQSLTTNVIKNTYYLLTESILEDEKIEKIIKTYYQNYDEGSHYLAALIHFAVLDNVKEKKIEFAFMLSNYVMYKRKRNPFTPFKVIYDKYFIAIRERNINKLLKVFASMEGINKESKENPNLEFDYILHIIKENESLIKNKYHIKKLYLYGSYAKNVTNINSDLDLLIVYKDDVFNFERLSLNDKLKKYLSNQLQINVDLIDFRRALNELDICEMENIITLI